MESRCLRSKADRSPRRDPLAFASSGLWKTGIGLLILLAAVPLPARERDKDALQWGAGLIVNVPFSEPEVSQVVQDVIQDGIIRGTKEYNKDEYVMGATAVSTTKVFSEKVDGKVFYKVRLKALDPRNFRDGGDSGTLAVRYVVQPQGADHTVLRIDARFVEDFRRTMHPSNGSVETAEYKDIHDRLDAVALMKSETAEAEREKEAAREKMAAAKQEAASAVQAPAATTGTEVTPVPAPASPASAPAAQSGSSSSAASASAPSSASTFPNPASPPASVSPSSSPTPGVSVDDSSQADSSQTLAEHVKGLRRQVQRLVKAPGAPLKSAPFHTASTLQSLTPGTEVLIVVSTPYWYGVETHDGQHGWMLRDDLELLP